jgi:hypothetical protein
LVSTNKKLTNKQINKKKQKVKIVYVQNEEKRKPLPRSKHEMQDFTFGHIFDFLKS